MEKKQVDIPENQYQVLKRQARNLGVSESELIHVALNSFLQSGNLPLLPSHLAALEAVIERAQLAAQEHYLPEGYRFNRDDAV